MTAQFIRLFSAGLIGSILAFSNQPLLASSIVLAALFLDHFITQDQEDRDNAIKYNRTRIEMLEKRLNHLLRK